MFNKASFSAIAAMAAFSMASFTACSDDAGSNPNPSAAEIQEKCRSDVNELCLVVSDKGKIEYFHSYMDTTDALGERMSNDFAGTDISVYTSVDSAGNAWAEKQCNAENAGEIQRFTTHYGDFSSYLFFKCSGNTWKYVKNSEVWNSEVCPEKPEIGDLREIGIVHFRSDAGRGVFALDSKYGYIYTSQGWILMEIAGAFGGSVSPETRFSTLVLDSDTDHPKYKVSRDVDNGICDDRIGEGCIGEWDWTGCDLEKGENCAENSRFYIKSNGEFDEERSYFLPSLKSDKLMEAHIVEPCNAATHNNGELVTVVDSVVFPNGQIYKEELQYRCRTNSGWDREI